LVLALAALIVAASAYAQPFVWPSAWTTATPDQVVRGGTFRSYMIGDPRTFNPITSAESQALSDHIFNGGLLITRGPDSDEWVPYAAESFTVAEDGRSVDVVLREGLVWSDGTPVTVDDYYTTYLLQIDPEVGSEERRVGKEGRDRGTPGHEKQKTVEWRTEVEKRVSA